MKEVNLKRKDETNGSVCLVDSIMTEISQVSLKLCISTVIYFVEKKILS